MSHRLTGWFSNDRLATKVVRDPIYAEALAFARKYEPKPDTNYEWVMAHAEKEYERFEGILDGLDSKADSLIRYMGAGSGVIALIFTYLASSHGLFAAFQVLPTLAMFFISILYASRARAPAKIPTPLHTSDAIKYAHAYKENIARASFAAMTGVASVGLELAITEKARLVRWSFRLFISGIFWLVLTAAIHSVFGLLYFSQV